MTFDSVSQASSLALSFTESPMFISPFTSDDSSYPSPNMSYDGVLHLQTPLKKGLWTQPSPSLRGGFRYLTLVSTSAAPVVVSNISCSISFMPHVDNMRDYSGYFYASDPSFHDKDFLTKVRGLHLASYAHVYAIQLDLVLWSIYGTNEHRSIAYRKASTVRRISGLGEQRHARRCRTDHCGRC